MPRQSDEAEEIFLLEVNDESITSHWPARFEGFLNLVLISQILPFAPLADSSYLYSLLEAVEEFRYIYLYHYLIIFHFVEVIPALTSATFFLLVLALLYPFGVFMAIVLRKWAFLILGLMPGHTLLIFAIDSSIAESHGEISSPLQRSFGDWPIYVLLALLASSIIYFLAVAKIRSTAFVISLILIFLLVGWIPMLAFLAVLLVGRFSLLIVGQNFLLLKEIGFIDLIRSIFYSLLYWWPLPLIALLVTLWVSSEERKILDALYENGIVEKSSKGNASDFRQDIRYTVQHRYEEYNKHFDKGLDVFQSKMTGKVRTASDKSEAAFDEVVPKAEHIPALQEKGHDCSGLNYPVCVTLHKIVESIKASIRSKFNATRDKYKKQLLEEIASTAGNSNDRIEKAVAKTKQQKSRALEEAEKATHSLIESWFVVLWWLKVVSYFTFCVICAKSLLYVFARLAFAPSTQRTISLGASKRQMSAGSVIKLGRHFKVSSSARGEFFVKREFAPSGRAPSIAIPQPGAGLIARLLKFAWVMNYWRVGKGYTPVHFTTIEGAEYVAWKLKPGEIITFNYKDFVGMSGGIKLSSLMSYRMTTLLLERVVFPTAEGPGTIVLLCHGTPSLSGESSETTTAPPSRIMAWRLHDQFSLDSRVSAADIYWSPIYLKPSPTALAIVDADSREPATSGLGRFTFRFIRPI